MYVYGTVLGVLQEGAVGLVPVTLVYWDLPQRIQVLMHMYF